MRPPRVFALSALLFGALLVASDALLVWQTFAGDGTFVLPRNAWLAIPVSFCFGAYWLVLGVQWWRLTARPAESSSAKGVDVLDRIARTQTFGLVGSVILMFVLGLIGSCLR